MTIRYFYLQIILDLITMPIFSNAQRLRIALGGFISFSGLAIIACAILTLTGTADLTIVFQSNLSITIILTIGVIEIISGLLLFLRNKEISLSLASNQEKTNNHIDQTNKNPQSDNP